MNSATLQQRDAPALSPGELRGDWDVAVIGAGPAGALAAGLLAQRQRSVLLVDKAAFPRRKVCGCCLNGTTHAVLAAVGQGGLVQRLGGRPLEHLELAACGRRARLHLPCGASLSREAFDTALVDVAVTRGARLLTGVRAILQIDEPLPRVLLYGADGRAEVRARVVLVAAGLRDRHHLHGGRARRLCGGRPS